MALSKQAKTPPHFQGFAPIRPRKPKGAFLTLAGKADAGGLKAAHGPRCGSSGGYWEFARSFAKRIQIDVAKLREHDRVLKIAHRGIAGSREGYRAGMSLCRDPGLTLR
jgi:hypothetical protein